MYSLRFLLTFSLLITSQPNNIHTSSMRSQHLGGILFSLNWTVCTKWDNYIHSLVFMIPIMQVPISSSMSLHISFRNLCPHNLYMASGMYYLNYAYLSYFCNTFMLLSFVWCLCILIDETNRKAYTSTTNFKRELKQLKLLHLRKVQTHLRRAYWRIGLWCHRLSHTVSSLFMTLHIVR